MQNEERINVLETQVQTLKKIVYGFGCLLVAVVAVAATSQSQLSNQTVKVQLVKPSWGVKIPITITKIEHPIEIINDSHSSKPFEISTK